MTHQCLEQCWILKESQDWNLDQSEGSKNHCVGKLKTCERTWKRRGLHEGQLPLEWSETAACQFNPKAEVHPWPQAPAILCWLSAYEDGFCPSQAFRWPLMLKFFVSESLSRGRDLWHVLVLADPSWFWLYPALWDLLHFHLSDLTQLLEGELMVSSLAEGLQWKLL